jgi:glycosyltransferase 2 family protein
MKRTWYLIISIALTAVIGYMLYRSVPDWGQAGSIMISGRPLWFLAGLGFVAIHMLLRALRWGVLLIPVKPRISLKNLLSLTIIKYVINVIPPRVGEIAGSVLLARKEKIPVSSVIATSVFERILDALAVLVLFSFYLVFFAGWYVPSSKRGQAVFDTIRTSTMVGLAAMVLLFVVMLLVLHNRRWHDRVPKILQKHVLSFMDGLRSMQSRPVAIKALLLSLLIWLAISSQLWCLTRAYLEVFPFTGVLLIMAITVVGVAIPTPGGVGGFQFFMNLALVHFFRPYLSGFDPESQAAGISNGVYILSMLPVILVGIILLHREGISIGRAAALSAESDQEP